MEVRLIEYKTPEYDKMVALRDDILRKPLGMTFGEEYLGKDKDSYLLGCFDGDNLVGCCLLTPVNENTLQLRQMAVAEDRQKQGIGTKVIEYAEQLAVDKGYRFMYLHARKVAVNFYTKLGYMLESDEFMEIGIPHFEMLKMLKQ